MREAHAQPELDQSGGLGRPPGVDADAEPLGGAPQQAQIAQRLGRRRQQQQLRVARKRLGRAGGRCARCGSPSGARRGARTRPRARRASTRAAARSARAGCRASRRGSGPSRARRAAPGSSCPAAAGRRRRPARRSRAPASPSSACSSPDSRSANTNPTRSASSRRATNASVCADTRSSHCASSTMHTQRLLLGGVGQQAQDRQPDEEAIRRRSGAQAERRAQRVALRARQLPRRPSIGAHSACRPAKASSISDSTPAARAIRHPSAAADRCRSRAVLPTPASPRRTSTRLWPARTPATSRSSASRSLTRSRKPAMTGGRRAWAAAHYRGRSARASGVGSAHELLTDHRFPEPVRSAAVPAPPRRTAPPSQRLGRGHGQSRGRCRVPRRRDRQRGRGGRARLRGPRGAGGRDARRGRADRERGRGARDGRRRGRLRDGARRAGRCAAQRRGGRLQPRGHRPRRACAIPTSRRSGSGRFARPRRRTATRS